jgi:long-chain fatty acid transport protein
VRTPGRALAASLLVVALARALPAGAAGFAVQEKSPRALGSAFAGEGALAEDAATVYFNPAGLTLLDGTQLVVGAHEIAPNVKFENDGSRLNSAVGGGRLRGPNSGGGEWAFVPTTYLSQEITPRVHAGVGVNAPFGLATEYDPGWVGRYHALKSALRTISVFPSLGVRASDWLSLGGGMTAEHAKATLTNAVDFGAVCEIFGPKAHPPLPASACPALWLRPQHADGLARVTGSGWAYGWNLGALLEPRPGTRVGLTYRSRIQHDLNGRATFTVPKPAHILEATGALKDTGAHASAVLPDIVSLSAAQQVTSAWAVFGDVTWTHWSLFRQFAVGFDNPKEPPVVNREGWHDSYRYALGLRYEPTTRLTFRLGTAYDESPIPSAALRTPRVPDSDRVWATLGAGWRWSDALRFDVGYAHVFSLDASTRNADPSTGHVLRGTYHGGADIVGVQASLRLW